MSSEVMERWKRPILIGVAIFCLVVFSITAPTMQMFAGDPQAFEIELPGDGGTVTVNSRTEETINRKAYAITNMVVGLLRRYAPTPGEAYEGFDVLEGLSEFRVWLPFEPIDETARSGRESYPSYMDFLVYAAAGEAEGIRYSDEYLEERVVDLTLGVAADRQFWDRIRSQGQSEPPPVDRNAELDRLYRQMGLTPEGMRRAVERALVASESARRWQVGLITLPTIEEIRQEFRERHPVVGARAGVFGTEAWLEAARLEFEEFYGTPDAQKEELELYLTRQEGDDFGPDAEGLTDEERKKREAHAKARDERIERINAEVIQKNLEDVRAQLETALGAMTALPEDATEAQKEQYEAQERTVAELRRRIAMLNLQEYRLLLAREEPFTYLGENEYLKGTRTDDAQAQDGTEKDPDAEFDARKIAFLALDPATLTEEQVAFMVAELKAAADDPETFEITLEDEAEYFRQQQRTRFLTAEGRRSTSPGPWQPEQGGGGPGGFEVQEGEGQQDPEGSKTEGEPAGSEPSNPQGEGQPEAPKTEVEQDPAKVEGEKQEGTQEPEKVSLLPSGPKLIPERTLPQDKRAGLEGFPNKDVLAWETVKETRQAYREVVAKRWLEHYRKTAVKDFLEGRVSELEKAVETAREEFKTRTSDLSTLEIRRNALTRTELAAPGGMGQRDALVELDALRNALEIARDPFEKARERVTESEAQAPTPEAVKQVEAEFESARQALEAAKGAGADAERITSLQSELDAKQAALEEYRTKRETYERDLETLRTTQEAFERAEERFRRYLEKGRYRVLHQMVRDIEPYLASRLNTVGLGEVIPPETQKPDSDSDAPETGEKKEGEEPKAEETKDPLLEAVENLWKQLAPEQKEAVGSDDEGFALLPVEERATKLLSWVFGTPRNPFVPEGQEIHRLMHARIVRKLAKPLEEVREAIEKDALPLLERLAFLEPRLDQLPGEIAREKAVLSAIDEDLQAIEARVRDAVAAGDETAKQNAEKELETTQQKREEQAARVTELETELEGLRKEWDEKVQAWEQMRAATAEKLAGLDSSLSAIEEALKAYGGIDAPKIESLERRIALVQAKIEELKKAKEASEDTSKILADLEELVRFRNEAYDAKRTFEARTNAQWLKTAYDELEQLFTPEKQQSIEEGLRELLEMPEKLAQAREVKTKASEGLEAAEKSLAEGKLEALRALPTLLEELAKKEEAKGLQLVYLEFPEWMTKKDLQREPSIRSTELETKVFGPAGALEEGQLADQAVVTRDFLALPALIDKPEPGDQDVRLEMIRRDYLRKYARQMALHAASVFTAELREQELPDIDEEDPDAFIDRVRESYSVDFDEYRSLEVGVEADAETFARVAADPIYKLHGELPSTSITYVRSGRLPNVMYRWSQGVVPDWWKMVQSLELRNLLRALENASNARDRRGIGELEEKPRITLQPIFDAERETYLVGLLDKHPQPEDSERFEMNARNMAEIFRDLRDRKFGEAVRKHLAGDALHKLFKDSRYQN